MSDSPTFNQYDGFWAMGEQVYTIIGSSASGDEETGYTGVSFDCVNVVTGCLAEDIEAEHLTRPDNADLFDAIGKLEQQRHDAEQRMLSYKETMHRAGSDIAALENLLT